MSLAVNRSTKVYYFLGFLLGRKHGPCIHFKRMCFNSGDFHIATIRMVSVTASLSLPGWQLWCLCLFPSAVVIGAASRPSLIKEHKGDCCGSNCVWVLSPGRPDRPASHGAGSSCVLCCLSHGQYSIVPQAEEWNSRFPPIFGHLPLNFTTPFSSVCTVFCLTPSPLLFYTAFLPRLFTDLLFSSTVSLARLSLPVCSYSSSVPIVSRGRWKRFLKLYY